MTHKELDIAKRIQSQVFQSVFAILILLAKTVQSVHRGTSEMTKASVKKLQDVLMREEM